MAARKHRFYVYAIKGECGHLLYVGKGCGPRAKLQAKRYNGTSEIIRSFAKEKDAYAFEVEAIASLKPAMNKHRGGNGSRATPRAPERVLAWEREMDKIGTRKYAARLILKFGSAINAYLDSATVARLREVAA